MPVRIDAQLLARVNRLARAGRTTPYAVLLAAFACVVGRHAQTRDLVVGSPVAGRARPELEGVVGPFINTLPIRVDLGGDPSFAELVARVRDRSLDALTYRDVPFDRIVSELGVPRDLSRNPLVQVLFALQNVVTEPPSLDGLEVEPYAVLGTQSPFDLALSLEERGDELEGWLTFNERLFDESTADLIRAQVATLLDAATGAPDTPLGQLPLAPARPVESVVRPLPAATAAELVAEQARLAPDACAVVHGSTSLTYAELDARVDALASMLRRHGAAPDVVVAVRGGCSVDVVVAVLAVLRSGAAYMPLDPEWPAERTAFVLADAGAAFVVADVAPAGCGLRVVPPRADIPPVAPLPPAPRPRNLAFLTYTSGSTGTPKGVCLEHRGLTSVVVEQREVFGLGPGDRLLHLAPFTFDAWLFELVGALANGATLCIPEAEGAVVGEALVELVEAEQATMLQLTPAALALLPPAPMPSVRTLLCVGDVLHEDLAATWASGRALFNGYGPTENTIWTTTELVDGSEAPTIGRPVANTRVVLLDDALEQCPPGVAGEICIGGVRLARGYVGRPGLTAERFVPDPFVRGERLYRTGDRGRLRADGRLQFLGRLDDQVKIAGVRVEPAEVEAALRLAPRVTEAAVVVRGHGAERRLAAFVVVDGDVRGRDLRAFLVDRLPAAFVPATVDVVDALPLTAHKKVDRVALAARAEAAPSHDAEPTTGTQVLLASIFAEVLGRDAVGLDDDFFALGGHSLLGIAALARVQRELGATVSVRDLFRVPTVRELATVVDEALVASVADDELEDLLSAVEQS